MTMNPKISQNRVTATPKLIAGIGLGLIILGYALFEGFTFWRGPLLVITSPIDGATVKTASQVISGQTARIAKIFLDDRQIFTQDDGSFKETLLLGYGYNIIKVRVEDQFGRSITKNIRVVLQ